MVSHDHRHPGILFKYGMPVGAAPGTIINGKVVGDEEEPYMHDIAERAALNARNKPPKRLPVEVRAAEWLAKHPQVYREFKRTAHELIMAGETHLSADMVAHYVRTKSILERWTGDYKVNNDSISTMARQFVKEHPQHLGIFEFRKASVAKTEDGQKSV